MLSLNPICTKPPKRSQELLLFGGMPACHITHIASERVEMSCDTEGVGVRHTSLSM